MFYNHVIKQKIVKGLVCPVSFREINENANRFSVFILTVGIEVFLLTGNIYIMMFVAFDYSFRIFERVKYSPLTFITCMLFKIPGLPVKLVNIAPKVFASRMGLLFALLSVGFYYFIPDISFVFAVILIVCTFLDSIFNVCFGCLIYHYIVFPFYSD